MIRQKKIVPYWHFQRTMNRLEIFMPLFEGSLFNIMYWNHTLGFEVCHHTLDIMFSAHLCFHQHLDCHQHRDCYRNLDFDQNLNLRSSFELQQERRNDSRQKGEQTQNQVVRPEENAAGFLMPA
jgi:hypothetical protein